MSDIDLVLRTAKRIALYVDQENGAPEFWDAVETQTPPDDDAARLRDITMSAPLVVAPDVARRILAWAMTLPEWEAEDAPEYAPHPILVQDAED